MAVNCSSYGLNLEVALCTDGPVGNGNSSLLRIYVADNSSIRALFDPDPDIEITPPQLWNGADTLTYTVAGSALDSSFGGCDVDSVVFTVTPVGGNQVSLRIVIDLSGCGSYQQIYSDCGNDAGPHQIIIEETVPFTTAGCTPPSAN
jgi:hypothetical protein